MQLHTYNAVNTTTKCIEMTSNTKELVLQFISLNLKDTIKCVHIDSMNNWLNEVNFYLAVNPDYKIRKYSINKPTIVWRQEEYSKKEYFLADTFKDVKFVYFPNTHEFSYVKENFDSDIHDSMLESEMDISSWGNYEYNNGGAVYREICDYLNDKLY